MTYEILLLTLHILGAAVMFGSVFAALFSIWKQPTTAVGFARLRYLAEFAKFASLWQLLTGALLYMREPAEFNAKPIFFVKFGLYVLIAVLSGTVLKRQAMKTGQALQGGQGTAPAPALKTLLIVYLLIIMTIVTIGVTLVSGGE